jgi:hypothetical protein
MTRRVESVPKTPHIVYMRAIARALRAPLCTSTDSHCRHGRVISLMRSQPPTINDDISANACYQGNVNMSTFLAPKHIRVRRRPEASTPPRVHHENLRSCIRPCDPLPANVATCVKSDHRPQSHSLRTIAIRLFRLYNALIGIAKLLLIVFDRFFSGMHHMGPRPKDHSRVTDGRRLTIQISQPYSSVQVLKR